MKKYFYPVAMFVFTAFIGMGIAFSGSSSVSIASADEYSSYSYSSDSSSFSSDYSSSSSMTFDGYCGNNICEITESIMASCPQDCDLSSSSSDSSSSYSESSTSFDSSDSSSTSSAICGNWVTEGDEECDDGPSGSEECSVICLAEYLCSCGCETSGGTQICAEERVPSNYCLNQQPKAKSKMECENKTGSTCSGYEKGNKNNKLTGTMKACTWKKKAGGSSSDGVGLSSDSSSSEEWSSSSF